MTETPQEKPAAGNKKTAKTERQILFLKYYLDPTRKETFSNMRQSALKAGFTQEYADNITSIMPKWLSESIGKRQVLLRKAERNLAATLDEDVEEQAMGAFGPLFNKETGEPIMKRNPKIMAIKHDATKFVAETLGKKHYSKRQEVTGANGDAIVHEYHVPKKQKAEDWIGNPPKKSA